MPSRPMRASGHSEDSSGNRNINGSQDNTAGALIHSEPECRTGDELLQQRYSASTIDGMARDLLPVIHLGEIIQKACSSRMRNCVVLGKYARAGSLASRAGRDAQLAAAAIPCGAAFVALQGLMPQVGLSTPGVFPQQHRRRRDDMRHSRPGWYGQSTGFLRSGLVQAVSLPAVPNPDPQHPDALHRTRETGLPHQGYSASCRHETGASIEPVVGAAMLPD